MSRQKAFQKLKTRLASPDADERAKAIDRLRHYEFESQAAVPALIQCLQDPDARVRAAAVCALGAMQPKIMDAVPGLLLALKDPDLDVRECATWSLACIGPDSAEAVSALMEAAHDEGIRCEAILALGAMGKCGAAAVPLLVEALADPATTTAAADSLCCLGPLAHEAVTPLMRVLKSQNVVTRSEAARALGSIGEAAWTAVPALLDALYDRDFYDHALGDLDEWLSHPNARVREFCPMHPGYVREAVASALWRIARHEAAIGALVELLRATPDDVRRVAATMLGVMGATVAHSAPTLIDSLTTALGDTVSSVRESAAWALGQMGPLAVDAVGRLYERTSDESGLVRAQASWALWQICQSPRTLAVLVESLRDADVDVRCAAARSLRAMGAAARPATHALEVALRDPDEFVRDEAKRALKMLEKDTGRWN